MADTSRARRRRIRRRRVVAIASGALVLAGGGAVAIAATGDDGPRLQLARVGRGSVTQTVESSGTVTSRQKVTPGFAGSGTVQSVAVTVGSHVSKGEVLARLETTALQADVDSAEAALASARQRLEDDRTGQLSSSTSATPSAASNKASSGDASSGGASSGQLTTSNLSTSAVSESALVTAAKPGGPTPAPGDNLAQFSAKVKQAQSVLLAAQHAVDTTETEIDAAQQTVNTAAAQNVTLRDAQRSACATGSAGSKSISTACASAMADYERSADTLSSAVAALDAKVRDQDAQLKTVDRAIATLDDLVHQLLSAAASSQSSGSSRSTPPTASPKTKAPTRTETPSSGDANPSAAAAQPASATRLAADQAAIDAATAQLASAKQNLSAATLTSPVTGTVAAVDLTAGASSSGKTITVIATGVQGIETSVPLAQVDSVKVGQSVTIAADGVQPELRGRVSSIGLLSSTSGSVTTFPVFVTLVAGSRHLFDGAGADVVIITGSAADVLTVPNSAVHAGARGAHTVSVLTGGKTTTRLVTLGVVGPDVSQVKYGLTAGERVVLADLSKSLPSSSTSNSGRGFRFGPGGANVVPKFVTGGAGGK